MSTTTTHRAPTREQNLRAFVVLVAFLDFIALGLFDGLLGVAWPSIAAEFGVPLDALGVLLIVSVAGGSLASFNSGPFITRWGMPALLIVANVLAAAGILLQAIVPLWLALVALAFVLGMATRFVDAGVNTYAAARFRARLLNWLHACFGIGTTLGSFLMTAVVALGISWRFGWAAAGAVYAGMALVFWRSRARWRLDHAADGSSDDVESAPNSDTLRLPALWLSAAVFFLYTGIEVGVGGWAFTVLTEARGMGEAAAGTWTSLYWGSLTVGRILLGFVESRLERLLRWAGLGVVLGAFAWWWNPAPAVGVFGIILVGFAQAPIFPALIALTPGRLGQRHAANAIGIQVAAANLGVAVIPPLAGVAGRRFGFDQVTLVVLASALTFFGLNEWLTRRTSSRP